MLLTIMLLDMRQGTFIAIEGVDTLGNASQLELLENALQNNGFGVDVFDFTNLEQPAGALVNQYLEGKYGSETDVGPYTSSLFFALNRYQASAKIKNALSEGKVVLATGFTGASMASQGSIFHNPEERRGFFVWLDNLEFQMLKLPRPDKTLVLRMPTSSLAGQLKNTSTALDDLCQLFPKDYARVDYIRSNKAMTPQQLHDYVWKLAEPLLPKKHQTPKVRQPATTPASAVTVPDELSGKMRDTFTDTIGRILELRRQMSKTLQKLDQVDAETQAEILESMLPVAAYRSPAEHTKTLQILDTRSELTLTLKETHQENTQVVKLVSAEPRNELAALPEVAYKQSGLPLSKITEQINRWSYEQKTSLFEASRKRADKVSAHLYYRLEILAPIYSLRELESSGLIPRQQRFTPRYGFSVPEVLDTDELLELYEGAFEESLKLHSRLQTDGHDNITPLATLRGHKVRFLLNVSGLEMTQLAKLIKNGGYQKTRDLVAEIIEKVKEVHPLAYEHYMSNGSD